MPERRIYISIIQNEKKNYSMLTYTSAYVGLRQLTADVCCQTYAASKLVSLRL